MMQSYLRRAQCALALLLAAPAAASAAPIPGGLGALMLDMRLRAEVVDQDGFAKDAQALTLRTRLGYETPTWQGFKALVEGENITAVSEDYNSTVNGKLRYPVVADPELTELNRAQISWTGAQGDAVVGRQRLILGNARFVGNVGFRQNEQTVDAAKASFRPMQDLTLTYAYLHRIHRIFGEESTQGKWKSDSHLMQADLKTAAGQLTGYGYLLEFKNAPTQSTATWGARLAGARQIRPGLAVTYEAEYARQTDYENNPGDFELDYFALGAGLKGKSEWASLNVERLDGDGLRGFATPLATLHAFQGWADVFLTTPQEGVLDASLKVGKTLPVGARTLKLAAEAHDFSERDGSNRYGRELDLLASLPINKQLTAELKAAFFDGVRPGFADRTKVWATLEFKY